MTDEHKQKLSESHKGKSRPDLKGKTQSEETRKKKSDAMKGKKLNFKDPESRSKKLSEALKGRECPNKNKHQSPEWREKISEANKGNQKRLGKPKSKEEKSKISNSKLGHKVSDETKQKIAEAKKGVRLSEDKLKIKVTKQYLTRKKNNSFNISKEEENFYNKLLEENKTKTIYRQYKDKRYPFYCDFYIKEDDLFIEFNNHWTHGYKPYDPNDEECQKRLLEWQEKAKTSQFYKNAIETWTIRDVKKLQTAKNNNLNYKVVY